MSSCSLCRSIVSTSFCASSGFGIGDHARPAEQRPPERDGEAEAVEDRQRAENRLEVDAAEDRADLRGVGEDVAVGQHDAPSARPRCRW